MVFHISEAKKNPAPQAPDILGQLSSKGRAVPGWYLPGAVEFTVSTE